MISGRMAFFASVAIIFLTVAFITTKFLAVFLPNSTSKILDKNIELVIDSKLYNRSSFGDWIDADSDCRNTRAEILLMNSSTNVSFDENGCNVLAGLWIDGYTGELIRMSELVDIDHVVSLHQAWLAGASSWSNDKRSAFANDPDNLMVTSASTNRSKGDSSPVEWLPPNVDLQCEFVARFVRVSAKYSLALSPSVKAQIREIQKNVCS